MSSSDPVDTVAVMAEHCWAGLVMVPGMCTAQEWHGLLWTLALEGTTVTVDA